MAYQIIWTKRANHSLHKQVSYVAENWSGEVVVEFVDKVYRFVELLADFPEMGTVLNSEKELRSLSIKPYAQLLYRIEGETIILLRFTDTRQNPRKK